MSENRLNGLNPLAYMGVSPVSVASLLYKTSDPTPTDAKNFAIGAVWINTSALTAWILMSLASGVATWVKFTGSTGTVVSLTGNSGGAVFPLVGNINVIGSNNITVAGNPATHTLTISDSGAVANSFHEDSGVATPAAGILNIFGTPNEIVTSGAGNTVTIATASAVANSFVTNSGTATPSAGVLNVLGTTNQITTTGSGNTVTAAFTPSIVVANNITSTAGNLNLAATTGATQGIITIGGQTFAHAFGANADNNTFVGQVAGNLTLTSGTAVNNTGIGANVLHALTTGANNVAMGVNSQLLVTSGSRNTSCGTSSLAALLTGVNNTVLGVNGGANYTGAESNNICINSGGTAAESNVLHIGGGTGGGSAQLNKAFISGIRGITTGNNDAVAVLVDSANQLGTISSSVRFKENINDMGSKSDGLMKMNPVVFNYKEDATKRLSYGLIAEEVEKVMPDLVVYAEDGKPLTLRYHEMPAMLLNELIKMNKRVEELERQLRVYRNHY
jgi:hypothetical protein